MPERDKSFGSGEWSVVTWPKLSSRLVTVASLDPELVVSGDCMAAIAAQRPNQKLLWFDAHGDFHTLATTETGNLGGMPLAMLMGLGDTTYTQLCAGVRQVRHICPTEVIHVGGTKFDVGERATMEASHVKVMDSLSCSSLNGTYHLHVDTDVISSHDLPSSVHPSSLGMRLDDFYGQYELALQHTEVLSIKTYDPMKDVAGIGQEILLKMISMFEQSRYLTRL